MKRIYLDHATTTPLAADVFQAMLPYLGERSGNPVSPHERGRRARQAVDEARVSVAALVRCEPDEIVFTGSATEANNLALKGVALASGRPRGGIIAAATEHISVVHPLRTLERWGYGVTLLPVDHHGLIDPSLLRRRLSSDTLLVSIAHASAEIGTVQALEEICRLAHEAGVPVHTDATVTAGALPLPQPPDQPDLITLTPHLFYGPPGVGALRVRRGVRIAPLVEGGTQEGGLRAGTESLAAIVGFGAAAALAARVGVERSDRTAMLARRMRELIGERVPGVTWTGHRDRRVPGLLTLCIGGVEAEAVLSALDAAGVEAASGSACTTEVHKRSHVLEAIGIDAVLARGALTFAFGDSNGVEDAEAATRILVGVVDRLRRLSPLDPS